MDHHHRVYPGMLRCWRCWQLASHPTKSSATIDGMRNYRLRYFVTVLIAKHRNQKNQLRKVVCANHLRSRVRRAAHHQKTEEILPNRAVTIYQSFQLSLLSLSISITSISSNVSHVINMA